jgi:methyl-accepting chemotaxis protein
VKKRIKLSTLTILVSYGLIFLTIILIGGISLFATYHYAVETSAQTMDQKLTAAESNVERRISSMKKELTVEGSNVPVFREGKSVEELSAILAAAADNSDYVEFSLAATDGVTYNSGGQINISDREYFRQAMAGAPYVSSPLDSRRDDQKYMMAASKLPDDSGIVFGLLPVDIFLASVESVKVGDTGFVFVLDKYGVVIAYPDDAVIDAEAGFAELEKAGLEEPGFFGMLEKTTPDMMAGENKTVELETGGKRYLVSYRPIEGPEQWSIGAVVPKNELFENFNNIRDITLIVLVIMLIAGFIAAMLLAKTLTSPIAGITKRIALLAEGDLHSGFNVRTITKEYHALHTNLEVTISYLKRYVDDIDHVLGGLADGDLNTESRIEYKGDFADIGKALKKILDNLGAVINIIAKSTESISAGSAQISMSAQSLLTGSMDAAGSIKNIDVSIEAMGNNLTDTVTDTTDASNMAGLARQTALDGNAKMQELLGSIDDINKAAEQVQQINRAIDDIAFQTNILSLNAAVEAARAGVAGRSFAVVADEVSMLAGKCAQASKDTAALIDDVLKAAQTGTASADETAATLHRIVEQSEKVNKIMTALSDRAVKQANEMNDVGRDMERLSSVTVATSSASAEFAETSKSFEQQATALERIVASFKLRAK